MARPGSALHNVTSDPARNLIIPMLVAIPMALALGFGGPQYMAALLIIVVGGGLFLANPRAFILAFLVLIAMRNFIAGGERIGGETFNIDLGGLANVLASGMGFIYFLVLWKNPFKGRSLTVPYGFFLGIFAISCAWAPDLHWAVRFVTRLSAPFFTYLIISDMLDRKMVDQVIAALYGSSVIPIVYGLYQWITGQGNDITEGYVRVNSSFFHPAHFGMYLVFLFCLAYAEFLDEKKTNRALRLGYILILAALEISTYTRITWVAMVVCWLYLSWVYGRRGYIVAGSIIGGFVLLAAGEGIIERIDSSVEIFTNDPGVEGYDLNTSVGWRLYFWDEILRRFWDRQWFGFGSGSSVMLGVELFGIEAAPHNGYLRVLYETGFAGLTTFAWVLFTMIYQAWRLIRSTSNVHVTFISHVYITMTFSYVLLNLTDNILEYYEVAIYQWAILSLVEYNNLRAARAGIIEVASFEEDLEVEDEAVEEIKAAAAEAKAPESETPEPPRPPRLASAEGGRRRPPPA